MTTETIVARNPAPNPINTDTPAALPLQLLSGVAGYSGITCRYAILWEYQLRHHLCGFRSCFQLIQLHVLTPFLSHARVQCNVDQVSQEVSSQYCYSNDQKDALQ